MAELHDALTHFSRTFDSALLNLTMKDHYSTALKELGFRIEDLVAEEVDAALGNGGLGRLAACYMDSLATLDLPAWGYGIRYTYGIFQQRIMDGYQVEFPDYWLNFGNPWEVERLDVSYDVRFRGYVNKLTSSDGMSRYSWEGGERVIAVAYDYPIPGFGTNNTINIRSFQKTVREVAGVVAKATKMATRAAIMKNPSKGRLLDEVFLLPPEMLAKSRYVLDDSPRRYIDTTSKPPPLDRKVGDTINLPNIFHNKTLRSTHKDAWIIALDPGATCIVGAVAYDPNHPGQRRNLAVTTKSLAEPERRYRNWLEADKPEAICTAERECTKSDQETWPVFLERFVRLSRT
ncbi:glycogen phosphorylase [Synchytrium endobioticum]|uniref:Alpha-1,4 glucan phosphorylase n=1 Tax=Synchytrium endobioticum TaxID=286115 RepID=A0A507CNW1_9FUNG|nr:glycogen phosphorylase [Synchytrium endobioticum]